jgi:hypothetical protein
MNNWEKCTKALYFIVENPFIEKGYKELSEYFRLNSMFYEKEVIDYLILSKFKNVNNTNIDEK